MKTQSKELKPDSLYNLVVRRKVMRRKGSRPDPVLEYKYRLGAYSYVVLESGKWVRLSRDGNCWKYTSPKRENHPVAVQEESVLRRFIAEDLA